MQTRALYTNFTAWNLDLLSSETLRCYFSSHDTKTAAERQDWQRAIVAVLHRSTSDLLRFFFCRVVTSISLAHVLSPMLVISDTFHPSLTWRASDSLQHRKRLVKYKKNFQEMKFF